jgi:hypothetical protein
MLRAKEGLGDDPAIARPAGWPGLAPRSGNGTRTQCTETCSPRRRGGGEPWQSRGQSKRAAEGSQDRGLARPTDLG